MSTSFHHFRQKILSIFRACKSMKQFKQFHGQMVVRNKLTDTFLSTKMMEYCAVTHGDMNYALHLFDQIELPNVFTWTTLLRGYVTVKDHKKAIELYNKMQSSGIEPNKFTLLFILKAYASVPSISEGNIIHGKIVKMGYKFDEFLRSSLIHLYSKCGQIDLAVQLFDEIPSTNVVVWNTMIAGCFACGDEKKAKKMFDEMPTKDLTSWNTAINGFSKMGNMDMARYLFDTMPERDLLSWSGMISGYTQLRKATSALELFHEMQSAGVKPDNVTMVSVLSACAQVGALEIGKWVHTYVNKNKIKNDVFVGTSLIDMYSKCGCIEVALQVFNEMSHKNILSWNAMLCGLAMHGLGYEALKLFKCMESIRLKPNDITFVGVLSACTHIGLVDEGIQQFKRMYTEFHIIPKIEHYGCMVDLFGRAGLIDEAKELIKSMKMEPNIVIWGALLNSCRIHGGMNTREDMMDEIVKLDPGGAGCYILLSNIYAGWENWDNVANTRRLIRTMGIEKIPGCSSIEINSVVHEFVARDKSHPNLREIFMTLSWLNTHLEYNGHVPSSFLLSNIDEELVLSSSNEKRCNEINEKVVIQLQ